MRGEPRTPAGAPATAAPERRPFAARVMKILIKLTTIGARSAPSAGDGPPACPFHRATKVNTRCDDRARTVRRLLRFERR
jgi:hypothetical protein